jgi:phage terminase small subunit
MGKRGPKKQPTERQRKLGNPSHRVLPDESRIVVLDPVRSPEPLRALGPAGLAEWDLVWTKAFSWLAESDLGAVQRYCEAVDDFVLSRTSLIALLAGADATEVQRWRLRKQVQDSHLLLDRLAASIGLTPSARAALGVAEGRIHEGMADLMDRSETITVIGLED